MNFLPQLLSQWGYFTTEKRRRSRSNTITMFQIQALEKRNLYAADLAVFDVSDGVFYHIHGTEGDQGQLSTIDLVNDTYLDIGTNAGFKINAAGFNINDGLIYGVVRPTNELIAIGSNGEQKILGKVTDLPDGKYFTGDFGADGLLYVRNKNRFYGIDVESNSVQRTVVANSDVRRIYDIALNPVDKLHYAIRKQGRTSEFISIDLRPGSTEGNVSIINDDLKPSGTYGAMFADATGRVFAASNKGGFYEIDVATGHAEFAGYSPRATSNDGAFSSLAAVNLPAVTFDDWFSTIAGTGPRDLILTPPHDLEGDDLIITVTELPSHGTVQLSNGSAITLDQSLTIEQLQTLQYDASNVSVDGLEAGRFTYTVFDGFSTSEGSVEITTLGLSRITGSVVVDDDTEDQVFEGYEYNNIIKLSGVDDFGNVVERFATTDIQGNFDFDRVAPGDYKLTQVQPDVVFDSHAVTSGLGEVISPNAIANIEIPDSPGSWGGFQFHENAPGSISGFVYIDENGSGSVDVVEEGIANVVLQLDGTDELGNFVQVQSKTNSAGFYEFTGLRPGQYDVTQIQPENYINAVENVGIDGGIARENEIRDIEVFAGQFLQSYNFGEYEKSSLSGFVFVDFDKDKAFDNGDESISGVTIALTGMDFQGNAISRTTHTDAAGFYEFTELIAGNYQITESQPEGFTSTYSHAGAYDEEDGVLPENGSPGADQITNIQLGHGSIGKGYNFSERFAGNSTNGFDEIVQFSGTSGNDVIVFRPGTEFHSITINGTDTMVDAQKVLDIRINGLDGDDLIRVYGTEAVEQVHMHDHKSIMRSGTFKVTVTGGEVVKMYSGGGNDRAFMWDSSGDDLAKFTQDYTRIWNDSVLYESRGYHRSYVYSDNGGNDRAYFFDSKYDDTFKASASKARMISRKFYSFGGNFESVYAYSQNGGNDTAYFWDSSASNDIFESKLGRARMRNDAIGMYNVALGFDKTVARATKGGANDRAYLFGTSSNEILVSSPRKTNLVGDGFEYESKKFERVYVTSNGGEDSALLFDSKLNDRFVATPNNARIYNDDYYIRVNGFTDVDAFSSKGGNDRAYFYDSENDDTLLALQDEVRFLGHGFDNTSHGFARNYAHSIRGGNDSAYFYDADGADTFITNGSVAKMYGVGYYNWANGFDLVEAEFVNASRHDRAIVFGAIDDNTIERVGNLSSIINQHAAFYVYDIDLNEVDGEIPIDDSDLISIVDDILGQFDNS